MHKIIIKKYQSISYSNKKRHHPHAAKLSCRPTSLLSFKQFTGHFIEIGSDKFGLCPLLSETWKLKLSLTKFYSRVCVFQNIHLKFYITLYCTVYKMQIVSAFTLYWSDPWVTECPSSASQTRGQRWGSWQEQSGCVLMPSYFRHIRANPSPVWH